MMVELPAGRFNNFEDDADRRIADELLEETGYTGTFKKVSKLPTSPYSTRYIHVYYATNCKKISEQKLDETEFIEVQLLSQEKMRGVLMSGESS
ncbi:MAG: NUDIX hydrolase, partial [Candidatus Gracilibacteria bacterium]|nr:NUDIX hydrolase [Candidatus Gracilibacteria bacterium]